MNERILIDPDSYFWLRSGQPLKSIQELALHLPLLSEEDFTHHVREGKNDFANWVRELFAEHELAAALAQCRTKTEMQSTLYSHIMRSWLEESLPAQSLPVQPRPEPLEQPVFVDELLARHWRY